MVDVKDLKVALVHDWLVRMRGGEKVLECFCEIFPRADIFTMFYNPGSVSAVIERHRIITAFVDRLPFKKKYYQRYLPLLPAAVETFNLKTYDLILSSSHCVAKGVRTPPGTLHLGYIHTPMRYVWDMYEEYFGEDKVNVLTGSVIACFANYLRMWDVCSSNRVDGFIANSHHVKKRIQKYYRREAAVIYPPVDTQAFPLAEAAEDYYLIISAMVPYKKLDIAVKTFNRLNKKLYIIGNGPEAARLKALVRGNNIHFLGWLPEAALVQYAAKCKALIFPGEEDFGIVPLELQCCGKPVIAYARGGVLETVIGYNGNNEEKCSGIYFDKQTEDELVIAIEKFETLKWDSGFIRSHAETFGRERFIKEIKTFINRNVVQFFNMKE